MESNDGFKISTEELGRMVASDWEDMKRKNDFVFSNHDIEMQCKTIFVLGYYYAWEDMSHVSKGLAEIDGLLK
jgi:hypothetical protein